MSIQNKINYNTRVQILLFVLSATIIAATSLFILSAILSLINDYRLGYEGYVMYMAADWSTMFTPIEEPPYVVTIYPPLYMIIVGALNSIVNDIILSARIVSILSGLVTAVFVWKIINFCSDNENNWISIVFALLFIANPVIIGSSVRSRPDILAVLFTSIALYVYISREGYIQLIGVGGFVLFTLFTKQSFVALPIAITLAYVFDYDWKLAVKWAIAVLFSGLSILLLLSFVTQGTAFEHLVTVNSVLGYSILKLGYNSLRAFQLYTILLALALLSILVKFDKIPNVLLIYAVTTFIPLLSLGKDGSALNLVMEQILALSIIGGLLLSYIVPRLSDLICISNENKHKWIQFLMIILIISQFGMYIAPPTTAIPGSAEVENTVQGTEGPILSENMVLSVKNDNVIMYQSFIYAQLVEHKYLNESPVTSQISNTEYNMIILSANVNESSSTTQWTPAQFDAIRSNYKLTEQYGIYYIYEPTN